MMSSEINKYIGETIRELRKAKNLTQEELSLLMGCTRVNLHSLEVGKQNFKADTIYLLCCIFCIQPNDLFPKIVHAHVAKQPAKTIVTKQYVPASLTVSGLPVLKNPKKPSTP